MAIAIEINKNIYLGDGTSAVFPFNFKIFDASELDVKIIDPAQNVTELTLTTDFTVQGVRATNGGSITLVSGNLLDNYTLLIKRVRPLKQTTSIRNETDYFASVHETTFDKLVMIDQQQQEEIDRSLKLAEYEDPSFDPTFPKMSGEISRVLGTDTDGTGVILGPTFDEIEGAQESAISALNAATAALASETTAASNATDAANAAADAANSAASAAASGFDSTNSPHSVTDGQSATNLTGETFDSATYSSILIFFEITRGTTVKSIGWMTIAWLNGAWALEEGPYSGIFHGVTWSLTGTTVAQIKAALDAGAGDGTIRFKKTYFAN